MRPIPPDREPANAPVAAPSPDEETRSAGQASTPPGARRRRGRPLEMSAESVLDAIRRLARAGGLFRVHVTHGALYARARRLFGSWSAAVQAAGLDYTALRSRAEARGVRNRRARRRAGPRRP